MAVVIHQLEHSPYCIPITAALRAFGVKFRAVQVSYGDRTPIFQLTEGSYHQVPVLVDGDEVIFESAPDTMDVARYVDQRWAGGRLFPAAVEGLQRIVVPHLENEVEGVTFRLVDPGFYDSMKSDRERMFMLRFKERKFGRGCLATWRRQAPQLRAQALALLTPYDLMLQQHDFLFGAAPVYADYALYGIIGNFTYRGINKLPPALKALRDWVRRIEAWRFA